MRLLVQPGDSTTQLVKGIDCAKKSVEIAIFRFDRREIENALKNAVNRGVFVHALIARTNRGGVESGASRTDRVVDALRAASPAPPLEPQIYAAKQTTLEGWQRPVKKK